MLDKHSILPLYTPLLLENTYYLYSGHDMTQRTRLSQMYKESKKLNERRIQNSGKVHQDKLKGGMHSGSEKTAKLKARQGKARQLYLYSPFHTQGRLKVLHVHKVKH